MADDDVDLVRGFFEVFDAGDREAALAMMADGIEWDVSRVPGIGVMHGRDAVRAFWNEMFGETLAFHHVDKSFEDAGDGRVLVTAKMRGVGQASGASVEGPCGYIWMVRDGAVAASTFYMDPEEARRDAGL